MAMKDVPSDNPVTPLKKWAQRRPSYLLGLMACLVASLLLLLAVSHLPVYQMPSRVGWNVFHTDRTIHLNDLEVEKKAAAPPEVPITEFMQPSEPAASGPISQVAETGGDRASGDRSKLPDIPLEKMALAFAEVMPRIQGGLGAYYLHIRYPAAAIEAGIQGRLILDFIVRPDGKATRIRLLKSLHPLCDSAAVHALRETLFMPGRQNGEDVPVRMRLPVLFRLVDRVPTDSTSNQAPDPS